MPGPIKKSAQAAARTYAIQEGDLSNMRKRKILPLQTVPGRFLKKSLFVITFYLFIIV
jgi:hypothetical protein